ncbi:efflux RND transporter periplasmic adaptor subunit [Actibacterium sp. 188UL27-1]|uniref:efflux RND transporter periplasmic adaptor subunit n=1 Tax=Actibacterium sp. 188UL27-1 TaxID=2786961 RepID=UPI00195E97C1|nr:efflux RND transporter periplasmic adaptor subunit [Actibacterium sp. 188UL27-1]MBM7066680.1 efflux RND transporter periplasmic adaptor subunit [Actibacterium sp. 188UL27-1]
MRPLSILTACLVMLALYGVIFERDRLLEFAQGGAVAAAERPEGTEDEEEPVAVVLEEDTAQRVSVVAARVERQNVADGVILRGRTEADREVDVKAETSGLVMSPPLRKGSFIEAGQLMCELDPGIRPAQLIEAEARLAEAQARVPEAQARVVEAEARLTEATINDRAASRLSQDGFASETRVAETQAAVSTARAAIEAARSGVEGAQAGIQSAEATVATVKKDIERLKITAPFAGLLETDTAELGTLLQPGALCATVIQLNPIKLVGFVPETEVDKIEVGASAGARLLSGREISGDVTFLSRSADVNTRTFRVEIEVDNDNLTIRDGQTAEIVISAAGADAHLIPASALTLDDAGTIGVRYVTEDQKAAFAPITVLRDTVKGVWVGGLPDPVDVIVVGQEFVGDGVPLSVTYREPSE